MTKKQVDNFKEGKLTPCCQLLAKITGRKKTIPSLEHQVKLKGAKYPNDVFVINLPAGGHALLFIHIFHVSYNNIMCVDTNLQKRSQTFGDLAAITAAGMTHQFTAADFQSFVNYRSSTHQEK